MALRPQNQQSQDEGTKKPRTRTRIRPSISDSLKDSLEAAQNPTQKKQTIQIIDESPLDRQQREKKQSRKFSKPVFGLDNSAAQTVGVDANHRVDQEQVARHQAELAQSRFAHMNDADEALVNNVGNQDHLRIGTPDRPETTHNQIVVSAREVDVLKEAIPQFHRVLDTPAYQLKNIRELGRTVFRSFSSYDKMEKLCREAGVDPLGQVKTITTVTDSSPTKRQEITQVAAWILQNGKTVESRNDFDQRHGVMNGYRPREVLATTDDMSFLLVHEDENGPMGEQYYIYAWSGGHVNCLENAGKKYSYEVQKRQQIEARPEAKNKDVKDIEIIEPNSSGSTMEPF